MRGMKYWPPIIVISCVLACALGGNVYANPTPDLNSKITQMIKHNLPEATIGVTLQDVATGNILYDYHGSKHFLPASTTKLLLLLRH